jgi:hypothetical protein
VQIVYMMKFEDLTAGNAKIVATDTVSSGGRLISVNTRICAPFNNIFTDRHRVFELEGTFCSNSFNFGINIRQFPSFSDSHYFPKIRGEGYVPLLHFSAGVID